MSAKARLKRLALLGVRLGIKAGDPERQVASKHIRLAVEWLVAEILRPEQLEDLHMLLGRFYVPEYCRDTLGLTSPEQLSPEEEYRLINYLELVHCLMQIEDLGPPPLKPSKSWAETQQEIGEIVLRGYERCRRELGEKSAQVLTVPGAMPVLRARWPVQ